MTAIRFQRVKPGDLITAALVNSILAEVESLQDQIDSLSGGQPEAPVITALVPAGDVPSPSDLLILGRNFAVPAYLNAVSLDDIVLTGFQPGSSDTRLPITVPGGLPGLPRTMTLGVATNKGAAYATVRIVPAAPSIGGKPGVVNVSTGGQIVTIGQPGLVAFQLTGENLLRAEQFRLTVNCTNADPAGTESQWVTALTGAVQGTITVTPGGVSLVNVTATPPAGARSATLSLQATSVNNSPASDALSLPVRLTVGQPIPGSDSGALLSFGQGGNNIKFDSIDGISGALVRYGTNVPLRINCQYTEAGTYAFALAITDAGALWTPTQPSQPVRTAAGPSADEIDFQLRLSAPGPSNEKRIATVTATRQDAAGSGRVSTISFPISGFA
jgi:hypothetical protein